MKKRFLVLLAACLFSALIALGGCTPPTEKPGDGGDDEFGLATTIDTNRTTLFVSNFNGGFGERWLKAAAKRYEELHKEDIYEEGKKGVQVWIDNSKTVGSNQLANIDSSRDAIFFTEYVYASDYAASGKVLDLSDIIKDPLTEYGEARSITDKMTLEQQDYFIQEDGSCYVLPHYQSFRGIMYDVDLFEQELFYFAADRNNGNDGFITSLSDTRSAGPDGESGSYDDGLPATYEEFFKLCDRMIEFGVKPVIWSGSNQAYFTDFLAALALDYEGLNDAMLNFTFKGTAYNLVESVNSDGSLTLMNDGDVDGAGVAVSPNNGYLLTKQAGKYYSLLFAEQLLQSKYIASGSMGTLSHTDAQKNFINSRPSSTEQTIGMIIEGTFWENECADMNYFEVAERTYGSKFSRENRRFAFMPYPKATEEELGGVTLTDSLMSGAFIRGNVTGVEKDLALDFLQFLYTDESLREFTKYTGSPKAMNYDIDGVEGLSYFTQSVFAMKERADIVYPYSSSALFSAYPSAFQPTSFYSTVVNQGQGNVPYTYPSRAIFDSHVTAKQYFEGLSVAQTKSSWENSYSNYFE